MALFEKGKPRLPNSGRRPGSPNKLTTLARERMEAMGCDPIKGLICMLGDKKTDQDLKYKIYSELCQYAYPRLRIMELTGAAGGPVQVDVRAVLMHLVERLPPESKAIVARELLELEKTG